MKREKKLDWFTHDSNMVYFRVLNDGAIIQCDKLARITLYSYIHMFGSRKRSSLYDDT